MDKLNVIKELNKILLCEMPQYQEWAADIEKDEISQRKLLRSLMNVRPPMPADDELIRLQNQLLSYEIQEKGVVAGTKLPHVPADDRLILWQGDIIRLQVDAIVNAANSRLLGCFYPCHGCIDNAIHSAAGIQLREECAQMMRRQGREEPTGMAKITKAYNLPSQYVIHTVGPIVQGSPDKAQCEQLASCYRACLDKAREYQLKSIAFCCISTGEFRFPRELAAEIAVRTVRDGLKQEKSVEKVIFNVWKEEDLMIYQKLLGVSKA